MQLKIFTGTPGQLQEQLNEWLQNNRQRLSQILQSQSTAPDGSVLLTITLVYETTNTGTGLGFRINTP